MSAKSPPTRARISIGIGSWADPEYTGIIYPEGLPAAERLKVYATKFGHVEVNASYYRTPQREQVAEWVKQTPDGFLFDVKLNRGFSDTPEKTGRDAGFVARWLDCTKPLVDANKLGGFLLVMPPSFGPKRDRLDVLDAVAEKFGPHRLAVELRNNGWIDDAERERTFAYFRARQLVWVAVDMPRIKSSSIMPPVDEVTNPSLAYLRLHGRNMDWWKVKSAGERHTYEYPAEELNEIAERVRALAEKAAEVHVVANNHAQDFAPKTALALQRILGL